MLLVPRLLVLLAALNGPTDDLAAHGEVVAEVLRVYDVPGETAISSGQLRRGASVLVRGTPKAGWLAIDPPPDAFDWVDKAAVELKPNGFDAVVARDHVTLRSAPPGARLPGTAVGEHRQGDVLRLVDAPQLTLSTKPNATILIAVLPAPGEHRYVRADGIKWESRKAPPAQETQVAYLAQSPAGDLKSDLAHTEAMHRAMVRGALETWQLDGIKARYQALLEHAGDSATASVIRERLAVVARQEQMVRDALEFESVLQHSRLRDRNLAAIHKRLASVRPAERPSFDAEGVIQPSSRKIQGEKALALIGSDGFAVAYLHVPPGIDTRALMTQRVGVRGAVHYDDKLRARVIAVHDIEPLERIR